MAVLCVPQWRLLLFVLALLQRSIRSVELDDNGIAADVSRKKNDRNIRRLYSSETLNSLNL